MYRKLLVLGCIYLLNKVKVVQLCIPGETVIMALISNEQKVTLGKKGL